MFHSDVVTNKLQYFSSLRVRQFISCTHRVAVMSTNTMRTMLLGVLIIIKAYSSYFISLFRLFYWICFTFLIAPEILIINTFHINFNYFFFLYIFYGFSSLYLWSIQAQLSFFYLFLNSISLSLLLLQLECLYTIFACHNSFSYSNVLNFHSHSELSYQYSINFYDIIRYNIILVIFVHDYISFYPEKSLKVGSMSDSSV